MLEVRQLHRSVSMHSRPLGGPSDEPWRSSHASRGVTRRGHRIQRVSCTVAEMENTRGKTALYYIQLIYNNGPFNL